MTLPYSKKPEESSEAFEAFTTYRDMGVGRSQEAVAEQLGKSTQIISRWSRKHGWVKRVHAWDAELDRRKRLVDLREVERMRKRQTQSALAMQELGNIELWKLLKKAQTQEGSGGLKENTIIKLLETGTSIERLNRGEPGEIIQTMGEGAHDLTGLTLNELKQLRGIKQKIKSRQLAEAEADTEDKEGKEK